MSNSRLKGNPCGFGGDEVQSGYNDARFVVLPVPYDGTSTWLKGAVRGPAAILAASANMELFDIETRSEPWRRGIFTLPPVESGVSPESMVEQTRLAAAKAVADGKLVVGLGGEHSVSIGLIKAQCEARSGLTVLQLDAHSDTRNSYEGSPCNHACVMSRVGEMCDFVQVGIRSMDAAEMEFCRPERTFFAHELDAAGRWMADVVDRLPGPVYVTIDLDVFDPSEMPSTGTPEPGGLRYPEVLNLLRRVCRKREVVGFDIVELMPNEINKAPDFLAARLAYQLMAYIGLYGQGECP